MRFTAYVSLLMSSFASRVSSLLFSPKDVVSSPCPALTDEHLKLAALCRDVYRDGAESCDTYVKSDDTDVQATVGLQDSRAIVCFRGSDSPQDWKLNLQMCKVPFISRNHKNAANEVHGGYFVGHNSVKAKIYAKLNAIVESGQCTKIIFTGHSAGGTLAAISAFDFRNDRRLPIEVVTFGSPKLGNASLASEFSKRINKCTRIVNDNDAVALAPLFQGFHHVGDAIHLRDVAPEESEGIWNTLVNFAKIDPIFDHGVESYVRTIEAHLKKRN